jgi:hypothetical protein
MLLHSCLVLRSFNVCPGGVLVVSLGHRKRHTKDELQFLQREGEFAQEASATGG